MNFHQQQQLAMAQQMAAQQRQGGGMTPQQQQQQLLMAQQMAAQYGGGAAAPQQGYQAAPQQGYQTAPQQGYQAAPVQQGANPYAQPAYGAAPAYAPAPAPSNETIIACAFPDGCMIGWDRLRNEMIINGKNMNTRIREIPARPQLNLSPTTGAAMVEVEEPAVPVEKTGMMTKLGWKKNAFGADSWQLRYFRLTDTGISYAKDASSPPISVIQLHSGITVNVVNAATPGRKNRYENNDNPGVGGLMSMNIGSITSQTSGPIGRENCVEMIVSGQIGTMMDGVMNSNAASLAFGGGMTNMRHQSQGRTYYFSCDSRMAADEWCHAITNNIKALPKAPMPSAGQIGGANGYAGLNNIMNNMQGLREGMKDAHDPAKSLQWYINSLGTTVPPEQVFALLERFYYDLDRNNVPHR